MESESKPKFVLLKEKCSNHEEKMDLEYFDDFAQYDEAAARPGTVGKNNINYVVQLEKEIETLRFQNNRLSRRIESMMKMQSTSIFGWLAPVSLVPSLFGSNIGKEEVQLLQKHLENILEERASEKDEYRNSLTVLNRKLSLAQEEICARDKEIEVLKSELLLNQNHMRQVQKNYSETLIKNKSIENELSELTNIMEKERKKWIEKEDKYIAQMQNLNAKAQLHEEFEKIGVSSAQTLAFVQERGGKVHSEDPGLVEEDYSELKAKRLSTLRLYKKEHSENEEADGALNDTEEEFCQKLKVLMLCSDTEGQRDFLKLIDCPYRSQFLTYKLLLEESEKKIKELEIKGRVLNKIITSSFKCPSCAFKFVIAKKRIN